MLSPAPADAYHALVGVRERGDQFRRLARSAITDLFDQRRPFGRLALTHVLMTAGDTMFAVSLAGSLFFSISPTAAKDKVLLYLLLTMAPFAVVAPALGPLIDRSRGARRAMVVASAVGRAVLCPFLARDIHTLLLFPEAFAMLVLSKVYLVTKGALVPEMAALGMLDDEAGEEADRPAAGTRGPSTASGGPSRGGSGRPVRARAGSHASLRHAGRPCRRPGDRGRHVEPDLATLNARLGLLASLSGFAFALPAVAILKLGGRSECAVGDVVVFAAAAAAGARLPVARRGGRAGRQPARPRTEASRQSASAPRCGPRTSTKVGRGRRGPGRVPADGRHRGAAGPDADVGAQGIGRVPDLSVRLRSPARGRRHLVVRPRPRGADRRRGRRRALGREAPPGAHRAADVDRRTVAGGGIRRPGRALLAAMVPGCGGLAVGAAGAWPSPRSMRWSSATCASRTRGGPSRGSRPVSSSCGWWARWSRWCSRCRWRRACLVIASGGRRWGPSPT